VVEDGLGEGLSTGGGTEGSVETERLGDGEVSLHLRSVSDRFYMILSVKNA
jgi:hypothetical protein